MSQETPTEYECRQLCVQCPRCGADPGEWCSNVVTGVPALALHPRRRPEGDDTEDK